MSIGFPQESQFDGAFGDVFRRVLLPENHPLGDPELGGEKSLVNDVFRVIRTHPPSPDGDARQRRIETVEMKEKRAKITAKQQRLTTRPGTNEAEGGGGGGDYQTRLSFDHL